MSLEGYDNDRVQWALEQTKHLETPAMQRRCNMVAHRKDMQHKEAKRYGSSIWQRVISRTIPE